MALFIARCFSFIFTVLIASTVYSADTSDEGQWVYTPVQQSNKYSFKFNNAYFRIDGENYPNQNTNATLNFDYDRTIAFAQIYRNRLFRTDNLTWSNLQVGDLTSALTSAKWKIDYDKKEIYKDKDGYLYSCRRFYETERDDYTDPYAAGQCIVDSYNRLQSMYTAKFIRLQTTYNSNGDPTEIRVIFNRVGYEEYWYMDFRKNTNPNQRTIMSDNSLALFILDRPVLANSALQYGNEYEYDHSPLVQLVISLFKYGKPPASDNDSTDNQVVTDPETGNSELPTFCNWAKPVCDFITWIQDASGLAPDNGYVESKNNDPNSWDPDHDPRIVFNEASCPAPMVHNTRINLLVASYDFEYKFEFDFICQFLTDIRKYLIFIAYFCGGVIIVRGFNA
ncbi:virulence factor TspB C-terminal domain-related protein [Acinetobacter towneri]|uniref:virulence factor TspB C-terminal domain-related protein n=1 Tax=Acinetobacter towneri TaxID=202956 RepID=UPI0020979497|nr:virulence factor TspB C-terminal domain-related protein [Acinetobacter towneri]MCO8058162.1 hypothetical protein [Acinetobacter towneri]MCO8063809.1 hypothetical protein [Acinetobacter towneri]